MKKLNIPLLITLALAALVALATLYFFPEEMNYALCGQCSIGNIMIMGLTVMIAFEGSYLLFGFIIKKLFR